jgi:hypothetical protein
MQAMYDKCAATRTLLTTFVNSARTAVVAAANSCTLSVPPSPERTCTQRARASRQDFGPFGASLPPKAAMSLSERVRN